MGQNLPREHSENMQNCETRFQLWQQALSKFLINVVKQCYNKLHNFDRLTER